MAVTGTLTPTGSTVVPPMDISPGRFAVCTDSLGAVFNVIALATP